jgi:hypothetical protein
MQGDGTDDVDQLHVRYKLVDDVMIDDMNNLHVKRINYSG